MSAIRPLTCDNESGPDGVGSTSRGLTHLSDLGGRGLGVSLPSNEEWRPVVGYEGLYEVSDHGRVRSPRRELTQTPSKLHGYLAVTLRAEGQQKTHRVHRLVAEAFIGRRPEGAETRHLDGDQLNNSASNLAYGSRSENALDTVRHGTHRQTRKTHCPRGHAYDEPGNLYVWRGSRVCRECISIRGSWRLAPQPCPHCGQNRSGKNLGRHIQDVHGIHQ